MEGKITKFKVVTSITDVKTFSHLIFDILKDKNTAEEIEEFLSEEFPEDGLQKLESITQSDYPLSFDRMLICHCCGKKVLEEDNFCQYCGKKLKNT